MDIIKTIKQLTGKEPLYLEDLTYVWKQYYQGDVKDFHNYYIYTDGDKAVSCKRKTLNMSKKICEDWANILLNEKTDVAIENQEDQETLNRLLNYVKFWTKGNEGIEKTFALGEGAFVLGITDNQKPKVQFVNREKIYPLTVEENEITECAFVNINSNLVTIQVHVKDKDGNYEIHTVKGKKKDNDISVETADYSDGKNIFRTGRNMPWFQLLKPNISNNININSPMGISIFANAIDVLQGVDLAYDGFCTEMQYGKARIFADVDLISYDEQGRHKTFDENDVMFYRFKSKDGDIKEPLKFYNPTLRSAEFYTGINNTLNLLSAKCGFGENHYRFDGAGISTATQVISENSEMFRTLKKHEILLNDVIIGIVKGLIYICNEFGDDEFKFSANALEENIEVRFDDSIIEDKETQKLSDRTDVGLGVMSKAEYRSKWFNEDLETAKVNIEAISQTQSSGLANFFSEE